MKKIIFILLVIKNMNVFAGGVEERNGQAYTVSLLATVYVQAFVTEGKFQVDNIRLGPGDSDDGTFKNNTWYWVGQAILRSSGVIRNNSAIQFKAGESDEYIWLNGQYTGQQVTVSNNNVYILWGTLSFNNNRPVIQIKYIDSSAEVTSPSAKDTFDPNDPFRETKSSEYIKDSLSGKFIDGSNEMR